MYIEGTIRAYVDDASAGRPTPGGGSVSALAAALGVTMGCMAANFTVGKKKFRNVEPRVKMLLVGLEKAREELLRLVDEDTAAYGKLDEAYAMAKETEEQASTRRIAIQQALKGAMAAPLRIIRCCRDVQAALISLVDIANPNLVSDVGVAAILADAAMRAARLNVDVNLKYIKDDELRAATRREVDDLVTDAAGDAAAVIARVGAALES